MTEESRRVALLRALRSMNELPMLPVLDEVIRFLPPGSPAMSAEELVEIVLSEQTEPVRFAFHNALAYWEQTEDINCKGPFGSMARRSEILKFQRLLAFEDRINHNFPVVDDARYIIRSDQDWQKWYEPSRGNKHYWQSYKKVLEGKGIDPNSIHDLSGSIDDIMHRLADPSRDAPYQSKGLVVGHVQSGKTSHFTGLIAKAISSGYKLIIVLTGTIEVLRSQTQRRLDMELVGKQNILQGRDENDISLIRDSDVDYRLTDDEWDQFVDFDIDVAKTPQVPQIRRLTTFRSDFKSLKQGLAALDFQEEQLDFGRPLFDPVNLPGIDVRLMVLKKNAPTLKKVLKDLKSVHANLQEVPALIIDDEADLASVNTYKPSSTNGTSSESSEEKKKRTAINRLISEFLLEMPRAQYVGYTATPFANVFIDPEDSEDIFPKDFIVSLPTPPGYMGGKQFHDLQPFDDPSERNLANSNELAFVRDLNAEAGEDEKMELKAALDSYVLSGAVKKFRSKMGYVGLRHHTMLAHSSSFKEQHKDLRDLILQCWDESDFYSANSLNRLWDLMQSDYLALNEARKWQMLYPTSKDELRTSLGAALAEMDKYQSGPVVILNSDKDLESVDLNFTERNEWRILTGGTKLSRGFTVEGLTVSYFRRKTNAQDSLMQMGRWFGYRHGYHDLVRLFIGRNVQLTKAKRVDLYEAFTSIVRDEEEFREKLKKYAEISSDDGRPKVTPRDVPPLVFQQLPWLKPTSRNKMFNARLTIDGESEKFIDKTSHLPRNAAVNRANYALFSDLILPHLDLRGLFRDSKGTQIEAQYGIIPAENVRNLMENFLYSGDGLKPTSAFVREAMDKGTISDFFVMVHLATKGVPMKLVDKDSKLYLPVIYRKRRLDRQGFVGTESKNRAPSEVISGRRSAGQDELAKKLRRDTRASMLISLVRDSDNFDMESGKALVPEHVAVVFGFVFPRGSAPNSPRVAFEARRPEEDSAIVDADNEQ